MYSNGRAVREQKMIRHRMLARRWCALLCLCPAYAAQALLAGSATGTPADSPTLRLDANNTISPWAGAGSLTVNGSAYSAAVIHSRHILTAAHVVKNIAAANITFNLNYGADLSHTIAVAAVYPHPGFISFNNPNLQHDLAVVELAADIPAGVPVYPLYEANIAASTTLRMVGYGASGYGDVGVSVGGSASKKRIGQNNADALTLDVDGSGRYALFQYDFDGPSAITNFMGGPTLGNALETTFASGDSGSPSFIYASGAWRLAGVNTWVGSFANGPTTAGTFGTTGGGNLTWAYNGWITSMLARPANDSFFYRTALTGNSGQTTASNIGAVKESAEPAHAGNAGGKSLWWKWTAPASGQLTLNTHGSGFNTLLAVYTGSAVNSLTAVASNNDDGSSNGNSGLSATVVAGTEYVIAVDGFGGANGNVILNWSLATDADLAVTASDSPDPVADTGTLTYDVVVTNNGPLAATGAVLTDNLPANVGFVSATAGCTQASRIVTCAIGNLAAGATAARQIVVSPSLGTPIRNELSVSATQPDANTANNRVSIDTAIAPSVNADIPLPLWLLPVFGTALFLLARRGQ